MPEDVGVRGVFKEVERGRFVEGGDLCKAGFTDKATSRLETFDVSMVY